MAQWHACKNVAHNAILFFRMGDFYEAFYEDAVLIAKELELTLTKRQDIPMSGVPCHTCEGYIDQLVAKGYRVAVAEQMEDPKQAKGLVKREIARIITPGTVINSGLLSDHSNNYFAAMAQVGAALGFAYVDLTTSEFKVIEFELESELLNEICRLKPSEFLISKKFSEKHASLLDDLKKNYPAVINEQEDWHFDHQVAHDGLIHHFKVKSLDGFGLKGKVAGINAAGALLNYLRDILSQPTEHLLSLQTYSSSQFLALDRMTQRNLELTESMADGSRKNTLLDILDHTRTPMGARLLRRWIKQPLLSLPEITQRQDAIQAFYEAPQLLERVSSLLERVRDLERLIVKIGSGYASPRDIASLRFSLEPVPSLKSLLQQCPGLPSLLQRTAEDLQPLPELTQLIANALVEDPPARASDGGIFREGFHKELDELRETNRDSKSWLARHQTELREQTGH